MWLTDTDTHIFMLLKSLFKCFTIHVKATHKKMGKCTEMLAFFQNNHLTVIQEGRFLALYP